MGTFRARGANEEMGAYLAKKRTFETSNTGSSGVQLGDGNDNQSPNYNFTRSSPLDTARQDYQNATTDLPSEADIRRQEVDARQAQIDSINSKYANLAREEAIAGEGRQGQQRSLSSVTGLLGSPRGQAQKEGVTQYNKQEQDQISAQKDYELQSVFLTIDQRVDAKVAQNKELELKGMEANIENLEAQRVDDRNLAASFFQSGGSFEALNDEDKAKMRELTDFDGQLEFDLFAEANKPAEEQPKEITSKWENGNFVRIMQQPDGKVTTETYTSEELGLLSPEAAVNPAFVDIGGIKYFYDKDNMQLDENGKPILQALGSTSAPRATSGGSGEEADVMPTNVNEAINISAQQLADMKNKGQLNDLVYGQYIKGLMADWGIEDTQKGEVESLVNKAMETVGGNIDETGSDFSDFISPQPEETQYLAGSAQAGEVVRRGVGKVATGFWPTIAPALVGANVNVSNFFRGVLGMEELNKEETEAVKKILSNI